MADSTRKLQKKVDVLKNVMFVLMVIITLVFVGTVFVTITSGEFRTDVILIRIFNWSLVFTLYLIALKALSLFK